MTAKRDLKKRIRDRQAKTGESYVTARRHVLAAREGDDGDRDDDDAIVGPEDPTNPGIARPDDRDSELEVVDLTGQTATDEEPLERFSAELARTATTPGAIQVDEVIDVSDAAGTLGLKCKVLVYERLAKVVEPKLAMIAIRDALAATETDPSTHMIRAVVAGKAHELRFASRQPTLRDPEFMAKIAAGLTAVSKDGRMIALHVNGVAGMVTVVCAVWRKSQTLIMTTPDDRLGPVLAGFGSGEALFLVYEGRRYRIGRDPFVIGRHPTCDLKIKDGNISRKHAAIVQRHGTYYLLDLGSHSGIDYRGMRISNKRIDEGDMFALPTSNGGFYALRFTFHETDA